jgi:iron-sulfur cluster assembly accessory protein
MASKMNTTVDTQPVVTLTESAAQEIKARLAADPQGAGKGLRLYVEKGGCSGMQYGMTFDERRPEDLEAAFFGVSVWVDAFSANYLRGSMVDFSDALTGGGFKITNPQAAQSCGCGKSFETTPAEKISQ